MPAPAANVLQAATSQWKPDEAAAAWGERATYASEGVREEFRKRVSPFQRHACHDRCGGQDDQR